MNLDIYKLQPRLASKQFDMHFILKQVNFTIIIEISVNNSDTLFIYSMKNLKSFLIGPDVYFDKGGIAMRSILFPVHVYIKENLTIFVLVYLSWKIQSIILSEILMCTKEIIERTWIYIQGRGLLQQPQKE